VRFVCVLGVQLHHTKHHAAYVANFNAALGAYAEAEAKGDVARMIALQPALKFNGGGARRAFVRACADVARAQGEGHTARSNCGACACARVCAWSAGAVCACCARAGHVNHSIFWKNLCPPKARACALQQALAREVAPPACLVTAPAPA
jgi:superoxide dismutase